MAHFARIDKDNIVVEVLVIEQDVLNSGLWGDPATFVQTSYNTRKGIYYTPNTGTPDPDQSKAFRKNYATIGSLWIPNGPDGPGFAPPKPYPSWIINNFSYQWMPPVPYPNDGNNYIWDEDTLSWTQK